MNQDFPDDEIQIDIHGRLGIITLNRPDALNALSLDMIRQIASILYQWKDLDKIKAVAFVGAGERAFCAGGDIKAFYNAGMDMRRGLVSPRVPAVYFGEEYSLNKQIFHYPKPTISLMDGITMGGGYGIGGNCQYRVATENTVFAMPEVGIGFFPDVGSMYHLSRAKGHAGRYLALTGLSVSGADMVQVGLADYYVKHKEIIEIADALEKSDDIESVLASVSEPLPQGGIFNDHADEVAQGFASPDVGAVLMALGTIRSDFAKETAQMIERRSPTSLAITSSYLERATDMDFNAVISTDFTVTQHFINTSDLYEGIRAQLIDKDRAPAWDPAGLEAVSAEAVKTYFTPTGYDLRDVQIFES